MRLLIQLVLVHLTISGLSEGASSHLQLTIHAITPYSAVVLVTTRQKSPASIVYEYDLRKYNGDTFDRLKRDREVAKHNVTKIDLTGLQPYTNYKIRVGDVKEKNVVKNWTRFYIFLTKGTPPAISGIQRVVRVSINQSLVLVCNATGHPMPKVTWYRGGTVIQQGRTLRLGRVSARHRDTYKCQATNGHDPDAMSSTFLEVLESPVIVQAPSDQDVALSKPFILNCKATGRPSPNITWYKDGIQINKTSSDGRLHFINAMPSDEGLYTCWASNGVEKTNVTRSANVTIVRPPLISYVMIRLNKTQDEILLHARIGERVELICNSDNIRALNYSWFRNERRLTETSHTFKVLINNSDDFGSYSCWASNKAGMTSKRITILPHTSSTTKDDINGDSTHELGINPTIFYVTIAGFTGLVISLIITIVIIECNRKPKKPRYEEPMDTTQPQGVIPKRFGPRTSVADRLLSSTSTQIEDLGPLPQEPANTPGQYASLLPRPPQNAEQPAKSGERSEGRGGAANGGSVFRKGKRAAAGSTTAEYENIPSAHGLIGSLSNFRLSTISRRINFPHFFLHNNEDHRHQHVSNVQEQARKFET